jgi:acetyl-CoA acetyltransferase
VVTVRRAYERSGYGPQDVQLIELHNAFTMEELVCPDTPGLVLEGKGSKLLVIRDTMLIGRIPANRNGGLIAMGHPLGLTGLGQIAEILWQMHRVASPLQIPQEVHVALAHMVGAGGVCVIHMLRR